jgi:hypothetical protein
MYDRRSRSRSRSRRTLRGHRQQTRTGRETDRRLRRADGGQPRRTVFSD